MAPAPQQQKQQTTSQQQQPPQQERRRFRAPDGSTLAVVVRRQKVGWLTYAEMRPKGGDPKRGGFKQHVERDEAVKEVERMATEAAKRGWRERAGSKPVPDSDFDEIPAAPAKPKEEPQKDAPKGPREVKKGGGK